LDNSEIKSLLQNLGERVPLVPNSFLSVEEHPSELHRSIMQIAKVLKIDAEPVPLDRFVPLPTGSTKRQMRIGQFGNLEIYAADPYGIALSKLDRGFDTDFEDIFFLIQQNLVSLNELERIMRDALPHARKYDFHPDILDHLKELKNRIG
jgi:hypothetical protein